MGSIGQGTTTELSLPAASGCISKLCNVWHVLDARKVWGLQKCAQVWHLHQKAVWRQQDVLRHRYGPGDQGAINHFYEAAIRQHRLQESFNTKPYHAWKSEAKIVHFHGPKPHEFLQYFETGDCPFQDYCQTGLANGFCAYAMEWASYIPDESWGQRAVKSCSLLQAAGAAVVPDGASQQYELHQFLLPEDSLGKVFSQLDPDDDLQY